MKNYIDPVTKEVYAYESDGSQDEFIKDGLVPISDADLAALRASQVTPPTYQELRASAYPPATNYLDAIVKGDTAQAQAYIDECLAVKAKYPK